MLKRVESVLFVICLELGGSAIGVHGAAAQAGPAASGDASVTPPAAAPAGEPQSEAQRAMSVMDIEARQHFQLGSTFYDSGRFQQAAEEFEAAYKLSGRPQLLYNIYVAKRDAGELPEAIEALRAYLEQVPDAPDRVNLKARLASLEAQAQRQADQEARAALGAASTQGAAAAPRTRIEKKRSVVPIVLLGTGGALLLGSVVTGVMALNDAKDLDKTCGGLSCPSSEKNAIDVTKTLAITTDVLWGVGAAAAATGLILMLTGALDSEREVPIAFGVGRSHVSTHFQGRF